MMMSFRYGRRVKIVASLSAADLLNLNRDLKLLEEAPADGVHIDVSDGHFASDLGFGPSFVKTVRGATQLPISVHLMVENPSRFVEYYVKAGADRVYIHPESQVNLVRVLRRIKSLRKEAGIALLPSTSVSSISLALKWVDSLLLLSNSDSCYLEWEDSEFLETIPEKISNAAHLLEREGISFDIGVDGGLRKETIPQVVRSGANLLIMGSAIFSKKDPVRSIREIRKVLEETRETRL